MDETQLQRLVEEIREVRFLLEVLASDKTTTLLERTLTTEDRRKVWTYCNGTLSTAEIAKRVGLTTRAVQKTIKELVEQNLVVVERRGFPKRRFDTTPSKWKMSL